MLPTLSRLSVSTGPGSRLRHWCSSQYLRISPLHWEFHSPSPGLKPSSFEGSSSVKPRDFTFDLPEPPTRPLRPIIPNNACPLRITAAAGTELAGASSAWYSQTRRRISRRVASSHLTGVYNPKTFILHAALLRQAFAHCQYSPLLPPVGVWAVSQSQCGRSPSQAGYRSSPW